MRRSSAGRTLRGRENNEVSVHQHCGPVCRSRFRNSGAGRRTPNHTPQTAATNNDQDTPPPQEVPSCGLPPSLSSSSHLSSPPHPSLFSQRVTRTQCPSAPIGVVQHGTACDRLHGRPCSSVRRHRTRAASQEGEGRCRRRCHFLGPVRGARGSTRHGGQIASRRSLFH